jgi:hypothetical protein
MQIEREIMSFQSDIEHLWAPPETLAPTLRHHFAQGVCTVFADEELAAAIPASQKQANMLADLMDSFAIALDDDFSGAGKDYFTLRDELCAPLGHILAYETLQTGDGERAKARGGQCPRQADGPCECRETEEARIELMSVMPDTPMPSHTLVVRSIVNGATAQIRSVVDHADRDEARRTSAELKRIAAELDRKHGFPGRPKGK